MTTTNTTTKYAIDIRTGARVGFRAERFDTRKEAEEYAVSVDGLDMQEDEEWEIVAVETTNNVTDKQINALRTEALAASDYDMAAICDLALDGEIDADDYTTLSIRMDREIRTMTQAQAIGLCADVINHAAAQA